MSARAARLAGLAKALFPAACALQARAIAGPQPPLLAPERAAVQTAIPARQHEFAAGRACARAAMADLGFGPTAIPMAPDRAPIWPRGLCGTISHADGIAAAVVARQTGGLILGFDIEADCDLPPDLLPLILTPFERAALPQGDLSQARLIFAAKEAAYKCQYPLSKRVLDFHAAEVAVDLPAKGHVRLRFCQDVPPFAKGQILQGRYLRAEGVYLVGFAHNAVTN